MVYLTLIMRPPINRVVNIVVAAAYGLTIIGSAVGEWNYFILGSVVEAILLILVIYHAWTWPRRTTQISPSGQAGGLAG